MGDEFCADETGGDGFGDGDAGEGAEQVGCCGQNDGLTRSEDLGSHHGGDGVGRIVKAVDIFKYQGDGDDKKDDGHAVKSGEIRTGGGSGIFQEHPGHGSAEGSAMADAGA